MLCRAARTSHKIRQIGSALLLWTALQVAAPGQTNFWFWETSANWESPYWSLGILPDANQTVAIPNPGYKAVSIGSTTVISFPASLTVSNLHVSAPTNALSTLLLNHAGTAVPLRVRNGATIGQNGSILNLQSAFQVDGALDGEFAILGGTYAQDGGTLRVTPPTLLVNASMAVTNSLADFSTLRLGRLNDTNTASRFTQVGGVTTGGIDIRSGTYDFVRGWISGALKVGDYGDGEFNQFDGTNSGPVVLGYRSWPDGTSSGIYRLYKGMLESTNIHVGYHTSRQFGEFHQFGGRVLTSQLILGPYSSPGLGQYFLHDGQLNVGTLGLQHSVFDQTGGLLTVTNALVLSGHNDRSGFAMATFLLDGGTMHVASIEIRASSTLEQRGGTNNIAGDLKLAQLFTGDSPSYFLGGGLLTAASLQVESGSFFAQPYFTHADGTNRIAGVLDIRGRYALSSGALFSSGIRVSGDMVVTNHPSEPLVVNSGEFALGGSLLFNSREQQLGPLNLLSNSTIGFGLGEATLRFSNSSAVPWSASALIVITNWNGSTTGMGRHRVFFGNSAAGLTAGQLAQIRFHDTPSLPGTHAARILPTGEVVPTGFAQIVTWGDDYLTPVDLTNVVALRMGYQHTSALLADGTVRSWGGIWAGDRTNPPPHLTNAVSISSYMYTMALRRTGTVEGWGADSHETIPPGLSGAVGLGHGEWVSYAIREDGSVASWGALASNTPPDLANVVQIEGYLALLADGTVRAWGNLAPTNVPPGLTNVVDIAAAYYSSFALTSDGRIVGWGENFHGLTNVPPDLTNVVAIEAGLNHVVALRADGRVASWGQNLRGETNVPPTLRNVTFIDAYYFSSAALVDSVPPAPASLQISPTGLTLHGPLGQRYEIQVSEDLLNWRFARNIIAKNGATPVLPAISETGTARFYRAVRR